VRRCHHDGVADQLGPNSSLNTRINENHFLTRRGSKLDLGTATTTSGLPPPTPPGGPLRQRIRGAVSALPPRRRLRSASFLYCLRAANVQFDKPTPISIVAILCEPSPVTSPVGEGATGSVRHTPLVVGSHYLHRPGDTYTGSQGIR
jgi:hypothetical protein